MKTTLAVIAALTMCSAHTDYSVSKRGAWPGNWPKQLEQLRKQSKTLEGPLILFRHHLIPFTKRESFESAWPYLLKVKSKGAPIILVSAPKTDFFAVKPAGVYIHCPPAKTSEPETPIHSDRARKRWMWTTYIELVVDGDIVDLNRIPIPSGTPIVDERFKDTKSKR